MLVTHWAIACFPKLDCQPLTATAQHLPGSPKGFQT